MSFDVILHKQSDNNYLARPVLWPGSSVQATTEKEVLERVKTLIKGLLSRTRLVKVEIDEPAQPDNPWIKNAGIFADDPTWDDFLQHMADYRREVDEEESAELA